MLAIVVSAIFGGLAIWHFAMALAPFPRESVAVPYVNGRPLFVPSVTATAAVGVGFVLCALARRLDGWSRRGPALAASA